MIRQFLKLFVFLLSIISQPTSKLIRFLSAVYSISEIEKRKVTNQLRYKTSDVSKWFEKHLAKGEKENFM